MRCVDILPRAGQSVVLAVLWLVHPVAADDKQPKPEQMPQVVLTLESVSAEGGNGDVLFECKLTVENNTGKELKVRSNFFSAFDGMLLVVRDERGKELKRQPYIAHQSPMFGEQEYPLRVGKTTQAIVFPVRELPEKQTRFTVQVVGTLPGSGYKPELSSRVRAAQLKDK